MVHCVVFMGKTFSQCLSLSTQEYKWVMEESGKPNEMLGVTLQWIGIPSPVLQFATIVPFCSSSSLKMKETKWTQCQESLMNCWGGGGG